MYEKPKKIVPLYFYNMYLCTPKIEQATVWVRKGQKLFLRYIDESSDTPRTSDYVSSIFKDKFTGEEFIQFKDSPDPMLVCKRKNRPRVVTTDVSFVADDGTEYDGLRKFVKAVSKKDLKKFKMVYKMEGVTTTTSYVKSINLREETDENEDVVKTDTNVSYLIVF